MKPLEQQTDDELLASLGRAATLTDAPPAAVAAATALFTRAAPRPSRSGSAEVLAAGLVRQLRAVLSFDSWTAVPLAAGLRSGGAPGTARQLVFSAEGRDVDLRIEPAAVAFRVSGQVLGPDEGGDIELQSPHRSVRSTTIDALGEFHFEMVDAGVYRLRLRLPEAIVELPPFEVGARGG